MEEIQKKKSVTLPQDVFNRLKAFIPFASATNNQRTLDQIASTFHTSKYIVDPHTSVALNCAHFYHKNHSSSSSPIIVVATAHWAKFYPTIVKALGDASKDLVLPSSITKLDHAVERKFFLSNDQHKHIDSFRSLIQSMNE